MRVLAEVPLGHADGVPRVGQRVPGQQLDELAPAVPLEPRHRQRLALAHAEEHAVRAVHAELLAS